VRRLGQRHQQDRDAARGSGTGATQMPINRLWFHYRNNNSLISLYSAHKITPNKKKHQISGQASTTQSHPGGTARMGVEIRRWRVLQ
jgi:hypothetical protein